MMFHETWPISEEDLHRPEIARNILMTAQKQRKLSPSDVLADGAKADMLKFIAPMMNVRPIPIKNALRRGA